MGGTPTAKWQLCNNRVWCLLLLLSLTSCLDDKSILLSFRSSISDPDSLLSSWDTVKSPDHCVWYGVLCDQKNRVVHLNITGNRGFRRVIFYEREPVGGKGFLVGELPRVVAGLSELRVLSLPYHALKGELPREIWDMENLQVIDLEGNLLSGSVPVSFSGLRGLRSLNLAYNEFSGGLPGSLALCSGLEVMNLAGNKLNGSVPWFVNRVKSVNLSLNRLVGKLPEEIGVNCDALESLDVSGNLVVGGIPKSLGNCGGLANLILGGNLLEETIPREIGRLEKLEVLDLSRNSLSGRIPSEIGNCSSLSVLVLSSSWDPFNGDESNPDFNLFHGGIPSEIFSIPRLKMLWAPGATLEGQIPDNWGSCEMLEVLNLANNIFSGSIPSGIGTCKNLFYLDFSSNSLSGAIPPEIRVSCMSFFDVSNNNLSGDLPMSQATCPPLTWRNSRDVSSAYVSFFSSKALASEFDAVHNLGGNKFTGVLQSIPISPSRLGEKASYSFTAADNRLNGTLPGILYDKCGGLKKLYVNMSGNFLFGDIPKDFGSVCKSLVVLDLSRNRISGSIPESLRLMDSLVSLNLSGNLLEGSVPSDMGFMKGIKYVSLAGNGLNGSIPSSLGKLQSLRVLDLSSNVFTGEIPEDVVKLRNLTALLLNDNKLSGGIPGSIANDTKLVSFNVSFNNLSGPLPWSEDSFQCNSTMGNKFLSPCPAVSLAVPSSDSPPAIAPPKSGSAGFNPIEIASIASASAILSVLILLTVFFIYSRKWSPRSRIMGSTRKEVTIFTDIGVPISFDNVVRATGGFNASNCIGNGGFGATYKAEISQGIVVAIKRLAVGRFQGVQQFRAEIKTLARLRHPNLVTLIGYHASETEMFLIYNYLPGGNLEKFIQERRIRAMDWRVLHKIALDIARALAYLHDDCVPRVLHRDVKPSNILLDEELNAYLSDFGLARLLGTSETHATTGVAGTFGYVAPEYAMTCRVSDKADVYSYGVVLLELLSDKKALDPSFSSFGNGFNIVAWAWMLLKQGRAKEFFTLGLWDCGPHDDLVEVLRLALVCTVDSLSTRPTMKQVVRRLKQLQPPPC